MVTSSPRRSCWALACVHVPPAPFRDKTQVPCEYHGGRSHHDPARGPMCRRRLPARRSARRSRLPARPVASRKSRYPPRGARSRDLTHGLGRTLPCHHASSRTGPGEQKIRLVSPATHAVVTRAKTGADIKADLRCGKYSPPESSWTHA